MWYSNVTPTKTSDEADALFSKSPYGISHSISAVKCENCEDNTAIIHCITCDGSLYILSCR